MKKSNMAELQKEGESHDLEHNKQTAIAFYKRAVNDKQPADAVAKYVGSEYIQHNPDTPDGPDAFIQSMTNIQTRFPETSVEIKRVIAEGGLVVIHNIVKMESEDRGLAGVDIFRLREGKIVEHWDVRQPIPERSENDNTMFWKMMDLRYRVKFPPFFYFIFNNLISSFF